MSQQGASAGEVADHFFRHEGAKVIATLTAHLGTHRLQLAEDVVQEALLRALQTWSYHGVPENPAAWLTQVAKNLALNTLRREQRWNEKQEGIAAEQERWLSSPAEVMKHETFADDTLHHTDCMLPHLAARDVTMLAVSRAPLEEIEAFKKRMGWSFGWVSSHGSDFNYDFHVSFTEREVESGKVDYNYTAQPFGSTEAPGISVFQKDADGTIYHTYSVYGRGVELMMGTYRILDLVPKGRDEDSLEWTMQWVRHHDRYDAASPSKCGCHAEEAKA